MMAAGDVLLVETRGAIAHLTLNRPEKRNALSDDLVSALDAYFSAVPDTVRAIVVSGAGGHFSSGLDLSQHVSRQPLEVMAHSRNWHRVMAQIAHSPVPVVAAMSGAVMGVGSNSVLPATCASQKKACGFRCPRGCGAFLSAAAAPCGSPG